MTICSDGAVGASGDELTQQDGAQRLTWAALTEEQRHVLHSAFHEESLQSVLGGWVLTPVLEGRSAHVPPLASAAVFLVEAGLVDVYAEPRPVGEGGFLPSVDGASIVADPANWWQEAWADDDADPNEPFMAYLLISTDAGDAVGRSRLND